MKAKAHSKTSSAAKPRSTVHFVPQYFLNPVHRISVVLVGAGGNGSQMLSALARIDHALRALQRAGIHVTVFDPDTVEEPNIGRQLFTMSELGQNKAVCLVTRFNRAFGLDWKAVPRRWDGTTANIIISCVDNVSARLQIASAFHKQRIVEDEYSQYYWLDLGNAQATGQAVLGSNSIKQPATKEYNTVKRLPCADELFDLEAVNEEDSGPSCSLAEALAKQDLFINSTLTQAAASLLWSILKDVAIDYQGFYVNTDTYRMSPITIAK